MQTAGTLLAPQQLWQTRAMGSHLLWEGALGHASHPLSWCCSRAEIWFEINLLSNIII